jgi:1-acyl-sn-glycerol-3-phosphate acyltransferase
MKIFRVVYKILIFGSALFVFSLVASFIIILSFFNFKRARPYLILAITLTSKVGLKVMGVQINAKFSEQNYNGNYLIVSNHSSYLDVLIISSFFSSCFVTSREMKKTLFLGQVCLLGGCVFVDRKNHRNIHKEVLELTDTLKKGLNLTFFPEAVTTDGSALLHFKRPLFQAALDAQSKILPICINYQSLDGKPIKLKNRDSVFWYGKMPFLNHYINLITYKKIIVDFNVLPILKAEDFHEKKDLAEKCYEIISTHFIKIN